MKQVIQDARSGRVSVEDVPPTSLPTSGVLVRTAASIVSAGTERDMLAFARKSIVEKARERPDLVRQVIDKARRDGIGEAYNAVAGRLDDPMPLGYSSAGVVLAIAPGVSGIAVGDRVACAGAGYAVHAEIVAVPRTLCVRIPDPVGRAPIEMEEAAFATLGAIALQGVRLAQPTLGERVVVIGAGIVGQLAAQLLRAHGCSVFALDRDPARVALALELGAAAAATADGDEREAIGAFTRGRGADAVIIAAATRSSGPVELAGDVSRRKGRVVVIGNVGLEIPRRPYYERELTLTVSSSYGPGRGDPQYEERGIDYPIAYVRWTEERNLEAVLDAIATGGLRVSPLITHRFPIERAVEAFELIGERPAEPSLGIVLTYPGADAPAAPRPVVPSARPPRSGTIGVGAIGAGSFARAVLLPRLQRVGGVALRVVAASTGSSAASAARRHGFERVSTDASEVVGDSQVDAVLVLTRHSLHAEHVLAALHAGRHVFVEKPLCVTRAELDDIARTYRALGDAGAPPVLMVGFNRRFSPLAKRIRDTVAGGGPLTMTYRVNAGPLPPGHWLNDPAEGGRVVGEACHFFDLAAYLTGARAMRVFGAAGAGGSEPTTMVVELSDGSVLDLVYAQDGPRRLPKERLEVFQGRRSWTIDDWRSVTAFGDAERRTGGRGQQKGHQEELEAFFSVIRHGGPLPIPFESLLSTTVATFCALESARSRSPIDVPAV